MTFFLAINMSSLMVYLLRIILFFSLRVETYAGVFENSGHSRLNVENIEYSKEVKKAPLQLLDGGVGTWGKI